MTKRFLLISLAATMLAGFTGAAFAERGNQPCSGKKGWVARCEGARFICNDGSVSQSKRNCSGEGKSSAR